VLQDGDREVAVKFRVRTVRAPFYVEKTLRLRAERPVLEVEETITNDGAEPIEFMWGHHPAFGAPFLSRDCRLYAPVGQVETAHALPARQILKPGTQFKSFPKLKTGDREEFDIAQMHDPSAGFSHLSYLTELRDGWYCLVNQKSRLGFALRWDVRVFRYLWLWQEFCGTSAYPWWGRGYCTGIEPHSSIPGMGLQKAIERGTQLILSPGKSLSTRLCASLFEAEGEPKGVGDEGQVAY
jgi:galactose mutarotase-like enzyme